MHFCWKQNQFFVLLFFSFSHSFKYDLSSLLITHVIITNLFLSETKLKNPRKTNKIEKGELERELDEANVKECTPKTIDLNEIVV